MKIADLVEIEGRKYDVVADKQGGVALEPAITKTVAEMLAEEGLTPLSKEEFEEQFGDLPSGRRGLGGDTTAHRLGSGAHQLPHVGAGG